jgi:excisionase family DNA binding protein
MLRTNPVDGFDPPVSAPTPFLTIAQLAQEMGVSPSWVRKLAARGLLPAVRHGRRWRISRPAMEQLHRQLAERTLQRLDAEQQAQAIVAGL